MKKILVFLMLALSGVAYAQSFPRPSDVSAEIGLTPTFNTSGGQNTQVNPVTTPPTQTGLTNIPIPSETGRVNTFAPLNENDSSGAFCKTVYYGGPSGCTQNKFRTHLDFTKFAPDDPIRNFGQPGGSHLHMFFGADSTNAYSTYKTLRKHAIGSTAMGTDANGTGYWMPAIIVQSPSCTGCSGKNFALKANYITLYYEDATTNKAEIVPGTRYVSGFDMDATTPSFGSGVSGGQYSWLQSAIDTANAASGFSRYRLDDPTRVDSFGNSLRGSQAEYFCAGATPTTSYYLVNPDGTDPYNGTCASGATFYIRFTGATCWNGKDLWSAGGYRHFIPHIYDSLASGSNKWVCPTNYYQMPTVAFEIFFTQYGWADRQKWILSSDLAFRSAHGLNSTQVPAGYTFHADWMHGWDQNIMQEWMRNCIGTNGNTGHTCNNSVISQTRSLIGSVQNTTGTAGAGGRNPQVNTTDEPHLNATDSGWIEVPSSWLGSLNNHQLHN